ncbi:MAG: UDP-N-acetylmuramoyl-L-alanyl-D-glutamate--2,6-diaminopimelate ligase, partial [Parachlamydiales bacterium]
AYLIRHFLEQNQKPTGLLGTVEYIVGKNRYPSHLTTPSAITLQKFLKEMLRSKMKAAVMEVSSHAIDQERCREIDFDAAVFTNLTQDHLDYHRSLENYAQTKARLFASLKKGSLAIVNLDDPYAALMIEKSPARLMTYGLGPRADLRAEEISVSTGGTEFSVLYQGRKERFFSALIGRFNVYNILAAAAVALEAKIPLKKIKSALASFPQVRGRLEKASVKKDFSVFIDYAHTDDALKKVLETLGELKQGRLITVFGCGGDRDQLKRPKMGRIAALLSDLCVLTSDNPRKEEPGAIIRQILQGVAQENLEKCVVEEDRFEAIKKALFMAKKGDIVLIAGKGHESYQIFKDRRVAFDDRQTVEEICQIF